MVVLSTQKTDGVPEATEQHTVSVNILAEDHLDCGVRSSLDNKATSTSAQTANQAGVRLVVLMTRTTLKISPKTCVLRC
jgi:hypothetical protein